MTYNRAWLEKEFKKRGIELEKIVKHLDYKKYRDEIKPYNVALDEDPCKNLTKVLKNYATLDGWHQRLFEISSVVKRSSARKDNAMKVLKSIIDLAIFDIQMNDDDVSGLSSQDKRMAAAKSQITELVEIQDELGTITSDARSFVMEIENKIHAVEGSYNSLSRQQSLIEGPIMQLHPEMIKKGAKIKVGD